MATMTYLQLCQKLAERCGVSGGSSTVPTTVVNQQGEMRRIVGWINEAYTLIQELEPNWHWMRKSVSFNTIEGQPIYTQQMCGITDLSNWKLSSHDCSFRCYLTSVGVRSEVFMNFVQYDNWRDYYQYGNVRLTQGRPLYVTILPNLSLGLGLTPDSLGYTIVGDYFHEPLQLTADGDIPTMPPQFHMLIVYQAMMLYGAYESAQEIYQEGKLLFNQMMNRLRNIQLNEITWGNPLA